MGEDSSSFTSSSIPIFLQSKEIISTSNLLLEHFSLLLFIFSCVVELAVLSFEADSNSMKRFAGVWIFILKDRIVLVLLRSRFERLMLALVLNLHDASPLKTGFIFGITGDCLVILKLFKHDV